MLEWFLLLLPLGASIWWIRSDGFSAQPLRTRLLALACFVTALGWMVFVFSWEDRRREAAIRAWAIDRQLEVEGFRRTSGKINWNRTYEVRHRDRHGVTNHTTVQVGHWFWGYFSDLVVTWKP